jgi:hypothetical protein
MDSATQATDPIPTRRGRLIEALAAAAILLAAAALRLVGLDHLPPGLFQDEAVNGVNALTILAGHPRIYYGEREPLFMYLAAFTTLLVGSSPFALRLAAAFAGILGVAGGGLLARQLYDRRIGLLTAVGLGASLWLTTISRIGLRAITLPAVESLGLALLWRAARTGRMRDYAIAGAVLGLALYTYLAARFLPVALVVFIGLALLLDRRWLLPRFRGFVVAGVVAVAVCLPLGIYALHRPDMLFGRPEQVALPGGAAFWPAFRSAVERTLGMLLIHGDENWRQNYSGAPVFDMINGGVFLLGLAVVIWRRRITDLFLLVLALTMLAPSMLSIDSPHYLRTAGAAPAIYTIWAIGVNTLARLRLRRSPAPAAGEPGRGGRSLDVGSDNRAPARRMAPTVLTAVMTLGVITVAFGRTVRTYFVDYAASPAMAAAFNVNLAAAGRFLASDPTWATDRADVYVTDTYRQDRASVSFFLYPHLEPTARLNWLDEPNVGTFFDQAKTIPLPVKPSLYIIEGSGQEVLDALGPAVQRTAWISDGGWSDTRAIWANPTPSEWFGATVGARFGQSLVLERAMVSGHRVGLRWKILALPDYQPSIFVHVLDAQDHTLAVADQVIGFPVQQWRIGQEFVTWHTLHLPTGLVPGRYRITAGVYRKETLVREPAVLDGQPVATVEVGELSVTVPVPGPLDVARTIDRALDPALVLAGYDLPSGHVAAGSTLSLTLVWKLTHPIPDDRDAAVILRSPNGDAISAWTGKIGSPDYPTSRWQSGVLVRQIIDLPVSAIAQGTATLGVSVGSASIELARLTIEAPSHQFTPPHPRYPLDVQFTPVGSLIGADLPDRAFHPGELVPITLYWKSAGTAPISYTVFVHLLDARNHVIAQRDEPPVHGTRPTTGWVANEYITDPHQIPLDPAVPPGTYTIEVGLYDPRTGARAFTGTPDNRVITGSVRVE